MVQQTLDSKFSDYGLLNPENNSPTCDKKPPVGAKKTPLRDLQNDNRIVPNSTESSPFSKDRGAGIDPIKVSGTKRPSPECPLSPSQCQSPSNSAANGHLVYVRRKCEAEVGKSSAYDCTSTSNCQQMRQVTQLEEINQLKSQIKDTKVSCFPAFAPLPVASLTSSTAKPSVPLPFGKSESGQHPVVTSTPLFNSPKGFRNLHWEERYSELQILLKKLDQSDQEDYTEYVHSDEPVLPYSISSIKNPYSSDLQFIHVIFPVLRSFSAVELSRHAFELEKRSIQLSLEEAKELQRVGILNVLGRTTKMTKAPSTQPDQPIK